MSNDVLIAGGYGVVGQRAANALAALFPGRVLIAGRDPVKAGAGAIAAGHGARGVRLDITDRTSIAAALAETGTVLGCIDQPGRLLLQAAVERGLQYTDITPHLTALGRGRAYQDINRAAQQSGAKIVL